MYRAIDKLSPTLLLDEADNVFADRQQKAELLGVVNSGWRRGQRVYRMAGSQRDKLAEFSTFCAKAIAGLDKKLAPTLASRCLRIEMRRRRPDEPCAPLFVDEARPWADSIREDLAEWAELAVDRLRAARPARLGIRDRLEEGVRLLLAIADTAGDEWAARARAALLELAEASTGESETHRVQLLRDLHDVFDGRDELATADLLAGLFAAEESPWREWWADGRPGDELRPSLGAAQRLAALLRPFGVASRDVGDRSSRRKGYRRADFADAFARYLPDLTAHTAHTAQTSQETADSNRAHDPAVRGVEAVANPHEQRVCAVCAENDGECRCAVPEGGLFVELDGDELDAELERLRAKLRNDDAGGAGGEGT
jgi:hypothetical protein